MKPVQDFEDEDFGYCFSFAPFKPEDPEYRQAYQAAQLRWLETWEPDSWDWMQ